MSGATAQPGLLDCAWTQMRVVSALVLRELQSRYGKRDLSLLWVFLEPLVLSLVIGLFHTVYGHKSMRRVFEFYAMGYLMYFMMRSVLNRGASAVVQNLPLLVHRRVTLLDVFLARHVIEFLTIALVMFIFQVGLMVAGAEMPVSPIQMLAALVIMLLLAQGLAFLVGAVAALFPSVERMTHVFSYLLLPVSGAFWMMDNLPRWAQDIVIWVPTVHTFELLREGQFGELYIYVYSLEYVAYWIVGLNLLGMAALRAVRRHLAAE
ncbi:MAG TPA: ABC transporter permease [Acetobacteraceae bacterium]|nr:ABC transporter permease [Acetobacteraceae bacterium]